MKVVNETAGAALPAATYWISGVHAVRRRLEVRPESVLIVNLSPRRSSRLLEVRGLAASAGVRTGEEDEATLTRIAGTSQHQGVVARVRPLDSVGLEPLCRSACGPLLVLDQVQDPHNLGALMRSAAALGISAVVLPKHGSPGITPAVERVSAGAVNDVPVCRVTNVARSLDVLRKSGFWTAGLVAHGGQALFDVVLPDPVALVLGGEGGLRPLVEKACDLRLSIPMRPGVESLNVSVAGAIAMYDLWRRKHSGPKESSESTRVALTGVRPVGTDRRSR